MAKNSIQVLYYCLDCNKIIQSHDDAIISDEYKKNTFCSEKCLNKFYENLIDFFESNESVVREENNLVDEISLDYLDDKEIFKSSISNPDEVYCNYNFAGDYIFSFIKQHNVDEKVFYSLVKGFMYQNQISFVLFFTLTESIGLIDVLTDGVLVEDLKNFDPNQIISEEQLKNDGKVEIPTEIQELIESKKSSLLAELIEKQEDDDISIENFGLYDQYLTTTLENPDEVFKYLDDENDEVFIYIKTLNEGDLSFYYIGLCFLLDFDEANQKDILAPIFSFPTLDPKLYKFYKKGSPVKEIYKN